MEGARPAGQGDLAQLARLLDEALGAAEAQRGGPQLLASAGYTAGSGETLEGWLDDGARLVLAGTFAGAVVGVGAGRLEPSRAGARGVVECCYVEPGARGVGVGTALAESLVRWFAEQGCVAVDVAALPGDRSTKQLFESLGFSARLLVLHRPLP